MNEDEAIRIARRLRLIEEFERNYNEGGCIRLPVTYYDDNDICFSPANGNNTSSVRVTNLSVDMSEEALMELFGVFGPIQKVYLAKEGKECKGYAFVNFYERDSATKSIEMLNGHSYDTLQVEFAC
jgi:hypothetical protein